MPEVDSTRIARQPFTFGGVARFAVTSFGRLLAATVIFGLVSGAVVSWLAATCLAPVVDEAISKLPETGVIEGGLLRWPEKTGRLLAANPFISFDVALHDFQADTAPVDFAIQFRTNQLVLRALLGTTSIFYPHRAEIELNRTVLSPAWGAWRAPILFGLIPGTAVALMLTWGGLAIVYSFIPLLIGRMFGRDLNFGRAWKLCVAAQLPGSLMMAFALALYSSGNISLFFVLLMLLAHFVPTLLYLLVSPFLVPKTAELPLRENPFEGVSKRKLKGRNPFAGK